MKILWDDGIIVLQITYVGKRNEQRLDFWARLVWFFAVFPCVISSVSLTIPFIDSSPAIPLVMNLESKFPCSSMSHEETVSLSGRVGQRQGLCTKYGPKLNKCTHRRYKPLVIFFNTGTMIFQYHFLDINKVFLSWSGRRSSEIGYVFNYVTLVLKGFLPLLGLYFWSYLPLPFFHIRNTFVYESWLGEILCSIFLFIIKIGTHYWGILHLML